MTVFEQPNVSIVQGFRVVQVEECWFKSLAPLMAEVRSQMGSGPVYLSFDIDALDPGFAPGTGTPEIAGLTPIQVNTVKQTLILLILIFYDFKWPKEFTPLVPNTYYTSHVRVAVKSLYFIFSAVWILIFLILAGFRELR